MSIIHDVSLYIKKQLYYLHKFFTAKIKIWLIQGIDVDTYYVVNKYLNVF